MATSSSSSTPRKEAQTSWSSPSALRHPHDPLRPTNQRHVFTPQFPASDRNGGRKPKCELPGDSLRAVHDRCGLWGQKKVKGGTPPAVTVMSNGLSPRPAARRIRHGACRLTPLYGRRLRRGGSQPAYLRAARAHACVAAIARAASPSAWGLAVPSRSSRQLFFAATAKSGTAPSITEDQFKYELTDGVLQALTMETTSVSGVVQPATSDRARAAASLNGSDILICRSCNNGRRTKSDRQPASAPSAPSGSCRHFSEDWIVGRSLVSRALLGHRRVSAPVPMSSRRSGTPFLRSRSIRRKFQVCTVGPLSLCFNLGIRRGRGCCGRTE